MVDINQPISRAFSISLRYFQFGAQLLISQLISKISNHECSQTLTTIGLPISYILLAINLIAILILKIKKAFNRNIFFVFYGVNVILAGVCMIVALGGIGEANSCANNKVVHKFVGIESIVFISLSIMTLLGQFDWALRYNNAPGNLVWPFLFLAYQWTPSFKGSFITVGIFTLFLSIGTFIVNLLPLRGGLTIGKKKIIYYEWIGGLILMGVCEIIVFATYLGKDGSIQFNDFIAKKIGQTYLIINIIDGLFWAWGLMTLNYTSGDTIRENIMRQDPNNDENDLDNRGMGLGTIR